MLVPLTNGGFAIDKTAKKHFGAFARTNRMLGLL